MVRRYTIKDFKQAAIGSFISVVVFLALKGGDPFFFNPIHGLIISSLVVWIYLSGFNGKNDIIHFTINLLVAFAICAVMGYVFNIITLDQILSIEVFGSLVVVAWWIAVPLALIYDRYNFSNPLRRYYIRGK